MSVEEAKRRKGWSGLVKYAIQAMAIQGSLTFLSYCPLRFASWFGSKLFLFVGPFLKADKVARRNLARAFPEWDQAQIDATVRDVWDNLGRGAGEFSHVNKIDPRDPDSPIEIVGLDNMLNAHEQGSFVILSSHMANWETAGLVPAYYGFPMNVMYRHADNPWMDKYFRKMRGGLSNRLIPKGRAGLREILAGFKNKEPLGLLIDQKLNEGRPIPFFGRDAMTANAPIELALSRKVPILPVRLERFDGPRFRVTICPAMEDPNTGDRHEDSRIVLTRFHEMLESWIREKPGQWFWVHKRWPD